MIDHQNKYIFIHIGKTGGSSIEHALNPHVKLDKDPRVDSTGNTDFEDKHYKLSTYIEKHHDKIKNYFKFAFVRNPWDREVSRWKWFALSGYRDATLTFLEHMKLPGNVYCDWLHYNKNYNVDYIGRFENLQQDFDMICDQIGIDRRVLPHTNKTKHKHYTEYYDDETRDIVAKRYATDIEHFGYEFGM